MSSDSTREVVRAVTRQVVDRLGAASPEVIEAVVAEVLSATAAPAPATAGTFPGLESRTTPRGAQLTVLSSDSAPAFDHCLACIEQEKKRTRQRAVLTTTGRNTKGIVARVTTRIAELGGDILDISQTLVGDFFTMIIVVDIASLGCSFEQFKDELEQAVKELGCQAMLMHEDVMSSLHRV